MTMKDKTFIIFLLTLLMSMVSVKTFAYDIAVENADGVTIYYNFINDAATELEVTFHDYTKYKDKVVIPNEVTYMSRKCRVTRIGNNAFQDCTRMTSVTIPNSVTSIGNNAFRGCAGMTSVTIPNSVTSIGFCAFDACHGLTSIVIPNSVTSIANGVFEDCKGLTSVTIPNSVTSIGRHAFYNCRGLTSVTIPNSVTSIGQSAFEWCSGLTSVTIPYSVKRIEIEAFSTCSNLTSMIVEGSNSEYDSRDKCNAIIETASNTLIAGCKTTIIPQSVTSIADWAFCGCSGLTTITIPCNVTSIGAYAFSSCKNLTSIAIPNSVTFIGNFAFHNCTGLTSFTIPNSVTRIENSTFDGCTGLTSVTIPNSVTTIGEYAFSDCHGLTSIAIPNCVTYIGSNAFQYCYSLVSVTIPDSVKIIRSETFMSCKSLTSITIPNSVTKIETDAFGWCESLTSVTIPNSVITIGEDAFRRCSSLTTVTIGKSVESIGIKAFYDDDLSNVISLIENPFAITGKTSSDGIFTENTFNNAKLYVPKGTIGKYKATEGWKDFLHIEEGTGPSGGGETPETKKCTTPIISYQNGQLTFSSQTEGATCHYTITDDDIKTGTGSDVKIGVTYHIKVYATRSDYEDSNVATGTLCWIDMEPKTEGITNAVAKIRAMPVLIQSNGSMLTISGAEAGSIISIYDADGRLVASSKASAEITSIDTSLPVGEACIVKIGEKTVKVAME